MSYTYQSNLFCSSWPITVLLLVMCEIIYSRTKIRMEFLWYICPKTVCKNVFGFLKSKKHLKCQTMQLIYFYVNSTAISRKLDDDVDDNNNNNFPWSNCSL